jgi:hypothetical protein
MSRSCCTAYSCRRTSKCGNRIAVTGQFFFQRTLGSKFIFCRKRNFCITIQLREEAHTLVHRSHQNWILLLLSSLSSYNSSPCSYLARYHQRLTKHVDAVILHEPWWVQYRDQNIIVHINTRCGLESNKLQPGNKISRDITFDRCSELKTRCACFRNKCEQKSKTKFHNSICINFFPDASELHEYVKTKTSRSCALIRKLGYANTTERKVNFCTGLFWLYYSSSEEYTPNLGVSRPTKLHNLLHGIDTE